MWASASPNGVSVSPRLRITSMSGAPTAMVGTMRVTSAATMKMRPLGVRNRVIAYAAGTASTSDSTVEMTAVVTLLISAAGTPSRVSAEM